ncbi:MAG TPA: hypothetical protein VFC24_09790 [Casimicrobiaceae bacterium]|nr:hypothetical protein [Casimicrobiaceae bacterium]
MTLHDAHVRQWGRNVHLRLWEACAERDLARMLDALNDLSTLLESLGILERPPVVDVKMVHGTLEQALRGVAG